LRLVHAECDSTRCVHAASRSYFPVLSLVIVLTDIPMGDAPLDMICVEEAGEVVHQIFLHPEEHMGKWLSLASSRMTITEYAATTSKVTGRKFVAGKASERCHL